MVVTYEPLVEWLVAAFYAYAALGLVFAVMFVTAGVTRLDEQARGTGIGFRLIVIPGVIALWPVLFYRWARGLPAPVERNPHR